MLDSISKVFKTELIAQPFRALDSVSFSIPEGSMVGYLGANGAGKTTSLKIIMDFIRPDSGSVKFSPKLGADRRKIFSKIGFLPERPYFYPNLTGREFLNYMGKLSEMTEFEIRAGIDRWAERFKIEHALSRPLKTYSKGMLQRTGFLATILHDPEFIILDEPLSGLDPIGRKELKDVIVEVHRAGKTVFFSSHIVPDVEEVCDRVIFIQEGKLVYDGAVESILNSGTSLDFEIKVKAPESPASLAPMKACSLLPGGVYVCLVPKEHKDEFLGKLVMKRFDVISLEIQKPSLEEIFYKIKNEAL